MKKIIPIITITLSAIVLLIATVGIILIMLSTARNELAIITVPFIIIALIASLLLGGIAFTFKLDVLCKISFFVNIVSFIISVISIFIWQLAIL